jgi:hypothetical protein
MRRFDLAPGEGLRDRLRRSPLPLAWALEAATAIASELRDLHAEGRAHGAVELESLRLSGAGISLGDVRGGSGEAAMERDIAGYGRILNSMLTGSPGPQLPVAMSRKYRSAQALRAAALDHARECVSGRPGIQRVATEVRSPSAPAVRAGLRNGSGRAGRWLRDARVVRRAGGGYLSRLPAAVPPWRRGARAL